MAFAAKMIRRESIHRSIWMIWIIWRIRPAVPYVINACIFIKATYSKVIRIAWVYYNCIQPYSTMFGICQWRAGEKLGGRMTSQIKLQKSVHVSETTVRKIPYIFKERKQNWGLLISHTLETNAKVHYWCKIKAVLKLGPAAKMWPINQGRVTVVIT